MNIYLDFDDTITESLERICQLLNQRYGKDVYYMDVGEWDFSDVYPDIPLKDIVPIFGEEEFFEGLRVKRDAFGIICRLCHEHDVHVVSKVDERALHNKGAWIKDKFHTMGANLGFIGIPLGESKGMVDMDGGIMVDDNVRFLNETNAKYKIWFNNGRKYDDTQKWDGLAVQNWCELEQKIIDITEKERNNHGKI